MVERLGLAVSQDEAFQVRARIFDLGHEKLNDILVILAKNLVLNPLLPASEEELGLVAPARLHMVPLNIALGQLHLLRPELSEGVDDPFDGLLQVDLIGEFFFGKFFHSLVDHAAELTVLETPAVEVGLTLAVGVSLFDSGFF